MENILTDELRYKAQGYKDRNDYLKSLAASYEVTPSMVGMIAEILGPTEDFDGLISELEDFAFINFANVLDD